MSDLSSNLVVEARPQVSVGVNESGDIFIIVAGIDDRFERVEFNEVSFPAECAEAVGKALIEIGGRHGAR